MINKEQLLKDAIEKYEGEIMILQVMVMGLKTELSLGRYRENNQSQQNKTEKNLRDENDSATDCRIKPADTHSTKQGHWEETEYEDGCHTHKDTVWVKDGVKEELKHEINKDWEQSNNE